MESTNVTKLCWDWLDNKTSMILSNPCEIKTEILSPKLTQRKKAPPKNSYLDFIHNLPSLSTNVNENYVQELIEYVYSKNKFNELGFRLFNPENKLAKNVCFSGRIICPPYVEIKNNYDMPSPPDYYICPFSGVLPQKLNYPEIESINGIITLKLEFGNIRPKEEILVNTPIYVGSLNEGKVKIEIVGEFLGDNINNPISCKLRAYINTEKRPMTKEDLKIEL